jgi:predicted RecA/RadA family phage recombinase
LSISIPGTPKKVGKSGDMVWVKSTTEVKLRAGAAPAISGATAVAPKEAASAPLKKPRRESACRTAS